MKHNSKTGNYIVVSGNMGSGKSTLCTLLSEQLGFPFIPEPYMHNPFLADAHQGVKGSHIKSQLYFLIEHWKTFHQISDQDSTVIKDSSVTDSAMVYVQSMHKDGKIDQDEYDLYHSFYNEIMSHVPKPKLLIYLCPSVDTLYERMIERNRSYETSVPKSYLQGLQDYYDQFIGEMDVPVLRLNDFNRDDISDIITNVKEYL
jgi:deoxyadenosine/deoxycytidine kinase